MATTWENIHVDDYGWQSRVRIKQNNQALDVASYTTKKLYMVPPSGVAKEFDINNINDGSDGLLGRTVSAGDVDEVGDWTVYARLSKTGAVLTTGKFTFLADERLD